MSNNANDFFADYQSDQDKQWNKRERAALADIKKLMEAIGQSVKSMSNEQLAKIASHDREFLTVNGKKEVSWNIIKAHNNDFGYNVLSDGRIVHVECFGSKKITPISYNQKSYLRIGYTVVSDLRAISNVAAHFGVKLSPKTALRSTKIPNPLIKYKRVFYIRIIANDI